VDRHGRDGSDAACRNILLLSGDVQVTGSEARGSARDSHGQPRLRHGNQRHPDRRTVSVQFGAHQLAGRACASS